MRILFVGGTTQNAGPANVNKAIVLNLTDAFWCSKYNNKYLNMADLIFKCIFSDVIVVSGVSRYGCTLMEFAKKIKKKTVYIMHGCAEYERQINNEHGSRAGLEYEQRLLSKADMLLPVSIKFMEWVKERYPQYADKTLYLFNGVDRCSYQSEKIVDRKKGLIVAVGGDRAIKNNCPLSLAVEQLQGMYELEIYGRIHKQIPENNYKYVRYMGLVPNQEFLERLKCAEIFVLNSILESFSLSVIEGLNCGCNVLISNYAGVVDVLVLEENDIIYDPMDQSEIIRKLLYLREHPNNMRISQSIDYEKWSTKESVKRLEQLCANLMGMM